MTTNISFRSTADEAQLDELLFSNGRTLQGARDIEIYDELSMRHLPWIASRRMRSGRSVWRNGASSLYLGTASACVARRLASLSRF